MESFRLHRGFIQHYRNSAGFTLIELLVVLVIITIITAVIFTSQSTFNKTLILQNAAYDIALSIRSAETYGLGSRAAGMTSNAGYGIHFQIGNSFTLFADTYPTPSISSVCHPTSDASLPNALPGNCAYDATQHEQVTNYSMGNGITVKDFCVYTSSGESCAGAHGGGLSSIDIVFSRPNPDTFISANSAYNPAYTAVCLSLASPQGGSQYVSVASSGEITTHAASCP